MQKRSVIPASFSSIEAYQTCPRQFYELKIAKNFVEQPSEAVLWGKAVHKALEERGKYNKPLPPHMAKYEAIAAKIERAPGEKFYEHELAVTIDLQPTGFYDDDCYVRGVEDVLIINNTKALSSDHKTGRKKPKSRQLELSALRVFSNFPKVQEVYTVFNWLASDPVEYTTKKYHRSQMESLWQPFVNDINQMLWSEQHNVWPAKPSGLCKKSRSSSYQGCIVATCPHSQFYKG